MIDLKYMIENELFITCPFLSTDKFITYCRDRGVRTSKEQLEQFEKLGIFYPVARVNYQKINIKIEYIDDGQRVKDLGVLEDGEEWSGDTEEVYAHFSFEKESAKAWLEEGLLWEPRSRSFRSWETFMDENGERKIESFYSLFQCYTLYCLVQSTKMELGAEWWVDYNEEEITRIINQISNWAKMVICDRQETAIEGDLAANICQVISNRYFPKTQSDCRTIQISGYYHHRNWEDYCRKWNTEAAFTHIGIKIEQLRHLQERVAVDARFVDPLEHWYGLISFVSTEQKRKLKDKALLAQTLYSMEQMLRLFYKDITGDKLRSPDELQDRWKDRFYGRGVTENEMLYLEFLTNEYHLNPRPKLILVVEGNGEAEQFPRLAEELLGHSFTRLGIEVVNIQGVGGFTGKKGLDKYGALERFIDAYHHRQTIVFIVMDNEGRASEVKKRLSQAHSKYNPKRRVTKADYVHIWGKNIEFDNFSHHEIARAMTELGEGRYVFQAHEVAKCESERDSLSKLFRNKLNYGLSKPKLLGALSGFVIAQSEEEFDSDRNPKRPILQLIHKIMELAARNYQPVRLASWEENQESGYLGDLIK